MTLLCFVVDVSRLQGDVLRSIQQCLLQLANLAVIRTHKHPRRSDDGIGLCTIRMDPESNSYMLHVIYEPRAPFQFREFSLATMSELPTSVTLQSRQGTGQVSRLSRLMEDSFPWYPEYASKRVIVISNCFCEPATLFRETIMEAARKCIIFDFIELDVANHTNDECLHAQPKLTGEFQMEITEFENCTFQRLQWNSAVMASLVKEWLQHLASEEEGSFEATLFFQPPLFDDNSQVFCTFTPAIMKVVDIIKPSRACKCHGLSLGSVLHCHSALCPSTGNRLDERNIAINCLTVGDETVLQMSSCQTLDPEPKSSGPVPFNVLMPVSMVLLSESLLFGLPYVVISSSEADMELTLGEDSVNNDDIFAALCEELKARDAALLCTSKFDIETGRESSFLCYYVLLPGNASLLVKRVAAWEELLPFPPVMRTKTTVSDSVKDAIRHSYFSKVEVQSYNPLEHKRGCDAELTRLVKESLTFPIELIAPSEGTSELVSDGDAGRAIEKAFASHQPPEVVEVHALNSEAISSRVKHQPRQTLPSVTEVIEATDVHAANKHVLASFKPVPGTVPTADAPRSNRQFVSATEVLNNQTQAPGVSFTGGTGRLRKNLHNVFPRGTNPTKPSLPLTESPLASAPSNRRSRKLNQ